MRPLLACALVLLVALPVGATDVPTLVVEIEAVEIATPSASAAPARCEITVEGRHGGASGEIRYQADEGQVRTRVGWWASLARGGDTALLTLRPGQSFSETYDLRLGCDARRRYRFVFTHEGTTHTHVYPSEDGYTQDRVIDLGAISRFFGIAAAEDAEPQPIALGGLDLNGEWVRRESNNDPNDGMRILVEGDRAVLTQVPETAGRTWRDGKTLWRDIEPGGGLRVLGSNDQFYPARLTASAEDQLTLSIYRGGAGSDQTWVRSGGCWSADAVAQNGTRAPDMWVRFSTDLPTGFQNALRAARDAGAAIQTATLTPDDEWVVVAANTPCYSPGFPDAPREWIDKYIASGREIDVVAFGPGGRWLVVAEDYIRRTNNVSDPIRDKIRAAQDRGYRITSFAFSDDPDTGWVFTAGGGLYTNSSATMDQNLREAMSAANAGQRDIHDVAIAPDGSWSLVAEDWFATRGAPASLLEWLEKYRTDSERRIDHVVLHPIDGTLRWTIVSNGPEPTPDPSDRINLVEHGLPGDSTIYQRMKLHGITGLSIAVIENNEVAWARAYGLREFDLLESYVYPKTIFDAASISKPVTYAAALQLVDDGDFGLTEEGVLFDLPGSVLPAAAYGNLLAVRADEINLAHLLSHCAGIDNEKGTSGAQAITPGDPLPTIAQVFYGQSPAASGNKIVRVDSVEVGEMVDYSGANSLLVQALIEDRVSGGYDAHMRNFLDALSMRRSTFDNDFWRTLNREWFARGHWTDSTRTTTTKADVEVFPNQAAAGLRTTASDLAQFVIMLNQNGMYDGQRILESATVNRFLGRDGIGPAMGVREAACSDGDSMQLGIRAEDQTRNAEMFWHGGLHNGYRTFLYGMPQQQAGLVILLTGSYSEWSTGRDVENMRLEIKDAVRNIYGWSF